MKKILAAIVSFGLVIAPLNSFGKSLSVVKEDHKSIGLIASILAASVLLSILIVSSNDKPVSP